MNPKRPLLLASIAICLFGSSRLAAFGWPSEAQEVARGLATDDPGERERAADRLVGLSPSSARPLVELALEDENDAVRVAAARAAVHFGYSGLAEQVAGWLKDRAPLLRVSALRVLAVEFDGRQLPAIARATVDPDEVVRSTAVRCLGRAPLALAEEVTSAATPALDDASPLVRVEAAVALGRLGGPSAVAPLALRLTEPEESVRRAAAVALGAIGDRKAVAALSFAIDDRSVSVAAAAAVALGELGDPSALPVLERTLLEPGWGPVHVAAAQALAKLDQRQGWEVIIQRLAEQDVAPALRGLLSPLSPTAAAAVTDCLLDSGGVALLECTRVAAEAGIRLDGLLGRARRGGLPAAKLFQAVPRTGDVELLVLAIERLARGTPAERHAALELLDRSAPLPRQTASLLAEALEVPGLDAKDVARLLLLLRPKDAKQGTLTQLARASDPVVAASARALLSAAADRDVLAPFANSPLEARIYGELLARGMSTQAAERLLAALASADNPLSEPEQRALSGLPADLPGASVKELVSLALRERGGTRDFVISLALRQKAVGPYLPPLFAEGSVQDRRSLTGFLLQLPGAEALEQAALADSDPWVLAQSAQRATLARAERLLALARTGSPAFVRSSALLGLARIDPKRAAEILRPCDLLTVPELGVRAAALWLVDRAQAACSARPLEDIVLLDREPVLRELGARALRRRDPAHRALRTCRAYDPDPDVALACAGPSADVEAASPARASGPSSVQIIPPWLDEAAPNCPYALIAPGGEVFIGVTDRRGEALVPGPLGSRILDPRVAL